MAPADYITIVSGLPRSGTSLMMQMLHAGGMELVYDDHRGEDGHNPRGYFEDQRVKRLKEDAAWLRDLPGRGLKVISYLLPALPVDLPCRVLFMERPAEQVLASQNAMIGAQSMTIAERAALLSVLRKQDDAAHAWIQRSRAACLAIPYPALLADPAAWTGRINTFLDQRLDEEAMLRAIRPELHRQR